MSKITWKGGALLAPVPPVLVTVGDGEKSNVFTVAWTGLINTQPPKTYISVRPSRYSYEFLKKNGEFALNLTPASLVRAADWCGIHTGRKVDKFKKMNLTRAAASLISVPIIEECPVSLECKVFDTVELGTHHMFLADIVAVDVDEELVDKNGRLCIDRAGLAAFAHGEYFALGRSLGTFGFSVKKKKNQKSGQKKPGSSKLVDKGHRKV